MPLAAVPEPAGPPAFDLTAGAAQWRDALATLALLPSLGASWAIVVQARSGPVRAAFVRGLEEALGGTVALPAHAEPDVLDDATDLTATLAVGRVVIRSGLLSNDDGRAFLLTGIDRAGTRLAHALARAVDEGRGRFVLIDESEGGDLPAALADRAVLHLSLDHVRLADLVDGDGDGDVEAGRGAPSLERLEECARALGIASLRPLRHAWRLTQLLHRTQVGAVDPELFAARLCLLPHARMLPQVTDQMSPPSPPPPPQDGDMEGDGDRSPATPTPPQDLLLQALAASIPPEMLGALAERSRRAKAGRKGEAQGEGTRGRPLPSRRGRPNGRRRIDVVATMRAAVPWQTMRGRGTGDAVRVRAGDIHLQRRRPPTATSVVFAVDASGSTALSRLAEAKGAVERLLAEGYARRDRVALIAFRRDGAETLLAPTRALARAKRSLAGLPGGGGTPLAAGLKAAREVALDELRRGRSVTLVLLTDGSANVDLDGRGGRVRAMAQAQSLASLCAADGYHSILIDVGPRPSLRAKAIADAMAARYVAMPAADADRLAVTVGRDIG